MQCSFLLSLWQGESRPLSIAFLTMMSSSLYFCFAEYLAYRTLQTFQHAIEYLLRQVVRFFAGTRTWCRRMDRRTHCSRRRCPLSFPAYLLPRSRSPMSISLLACHYFFSLSCCTYLPHVAVFASISRSLNHSHSVIVLFRFSTRESRPHCVQLSASTQDSRRRTKEEKMHIAKIRNV